MKNHLPFLKHILQDLYTLIPGALSLPCLCFLAPCFPGLEKVPLQTLRRQRQMSPLCCFLNLSPVIFINLSPILIYLSPLNYKHFERSYVFEGLALCLILIRICWMNHSNNQWAESQPWYESGWVNSRGKYMRIRACGSERVCLDSSPEVLTNFTHTSPRELLHHLCQQEAEATNMEIKYSCKRQHF